MLTLSAILETAVEAIITINENGIVESFNKTAERMFGYAATEVVDRNVSLLMPQPYSDEHDQLFQPFFTTKRTGTGLGMAIASRIVDAHHGQISVKSDNGAGAEFVIVVPRKQP